MIRTKFVLVALVSLTSVLTSATDYSTRPVNNCVYRGGLDSSYQQCVQDYENRLREYNAFNSTTTGVRAPTAPTYSECNRTDTITGTVSQDGDCRQRLDAAYQQELQRYNTIRQQEEAARQEAAYQAQQLQASRQAAQEAEKKAKDGEKKALRSQILTAVASAVAFSQCSGTNVAACVVGAFMQVMSSKAGTQAGSFATAARQGCIAGNAYGSTQANCGPAPNPFSPTGFPNNTQPPLNTLVDNNGNCTASAEICNDLLNGLPPGTTLSDLARGINAFAGPKPIARVDKDGNIITRDGKKFSADGLDSEAELKAAGLSGGQAAALLAAANKAGGDGALAAASDSSSALNLDGGAGEESSGKSGIIGAGGNGEADGSELNADKKRNLASAAEGLAKDFNGELIGVAGDDIFKMMSRRYVLKAKQDSFLAP